MQKDVTLSTRVSSGLRDEINKDAEEAQISQAEWLRSAAESYLAAGGNQADLLRLTPKDKLQVIQNHIEEIEDFNSNLDETDEHLEKMVEDFNEDLEILKDRHDDLDEDDEDYDDLYDDLNEQLDSLLDQVNDQLDDLSDDPEDDDDDDEDGEAEADEETR